MVKYINIPTGKLLSIPTNKLLQTSSLWTPADISTIAWYDASDLSTITESGGSVSQWDDKSGNGHHFEQANGSNQPTTNLRTLNGVNILNFDGNDYMVHSTFPVPSSGDFAVFMVAEIDVIGTQRDSLISMNAASHDWQYESNNSFVFTGTLNVSDIGSNAIGSGSNPGPSVYNINFDYNGLGQYNSYIDGAIHLTGTSYTAKVGTSQTLQLMSNRAVSAWINGACGEVIIIEDVTIATREKMEGYLAWKWSLQANLPSGHPYRHERPIHNN